MRGIGEVGLLTESEREIQRAVDELAETYGESYVRQCRAEDRFPSELWNDLADLGFLGMNVPEEYGGTGLTLKQMAVLTERLSYHGMDLLYLLITATMAPIPIKKHGSESLKERFLPKIANGTLRFCFAITEAEAGTNSARIATMAERRGSEYVINGEKFFISDAAESDYIQLVVRTRPLAEVEDENIYAGVSILLVPTDTRGISFTPLDLEIAGVTDQYAVHFDNALVPVENRIGEEGRGFEYMFDALNPERIFSAASTVGGGNRVIEKAAAQARAREAFNQPVGAYQAVQHPLAEAKIDLVFAWLATLEAAEAFESDQGRVDALSSMVNYASAMANWDAVNAAIQVLGTQAFHPDVGFGELLVGSRLSRIAPLNNEMELNHVAEQVLDLPRSY